MQTLGTFIASNHKRIAWYWLWLAASAVLVGTLTYSWVVYNGDISFGRLEKIPPVRVEWYHAAAPLILVALTRFGLPVSTTFLVLSTFASTVVLQSMLVKSIVGYGVAAVVAYGLWMIISRIINEKYDKVPKNRRKFWRALQWIATGFLWFSWLSHDMANIAVFLPRQLPIEIFAGVLVILCGWLAYIFLTHGGKIQQIVLDKSGTRFVRSATIIDFVYAAILLYFKELNSLPMSTTWVFVGVLTGRELAIATTYRKKYKMKSVFPIIGKDFLKMMIGLGVSVALVLAIHYGVTGPAE
ncbi:MAG: hypothetical protein LRY57_03140 [Alphaproteobacteria bacterium]|nr:hypothetical protein [Alphaproteobacteria bacterium]MCD8526249.1 hypothetical protein [Alphaproteobacteria bacterium]